MLRENLPECYFNVRLNINNLEDIKAIAENIKELFDIRVELPSKLKLKIKESPDLTHIPPCRWVLERGSYDPNQQEIRLIGPNWCLKTIIHELLHALSIFYREEDLIWSSLIDFRNIVEALTEFLTGYVLYRKRDEKPCYDFWLEKTYAPCKISYEPYVKIFAALSQVLVPLKTISRLFFCETYHDWQKMYDHFLKTYKLPHLFKNWRTPYELQEEILNALKKYYPIRIAHRFEIILENELRNLFNYSRMKKF